MRYPPGHKAKTREKILEAAGRVFRRQGYHATGVDGVMEEAGLTAGGFYAHFASKQALLAELFEYFRGQFNIKADDQATRTDVRKDLDAFVTRYLGDVHLQKIEEGCPLAALLSEVCRSDDSVKKGFEAMVLDFQRLATTQGPDGQPAFNEEQALATLALCVGGIGLARSVQDGELAGKILESCKQAAQSILDRGETPGFKAKPERKSRA